MSEKPGLLMAPPFEGYGESFASLPSRVRGPILLVESRGLPREWLRAWLRAIGDRDVVCLDTLDSGDVAVARVAAAVILSIGATTPKPWVKAQITRINARPPDAPLVVIADSSDAAEEILAACAVQALVPSASGAICAAAVLHLVLADGVSFANAAERQVNAIEVANGNGSARSAAAPKLTERERSVLEQLQYGLSNKIIARELGISQSTVKVHVQNIIRKLRARNRTEAAVISRSAAARNSAHPRSLA